MVEVGEERGEVADIFESVVARVWYVLVEPAFEKVCCSCWPSSPGYGGVESCNIYPAGNGLIVYISVLYCKTSCQDSNVHLVNKQNAQRSSTIICIRVALVK